MAINTDEASLARLPLTSCCAAQFLTGHGPVLVDSPGVGDPRLGVRLDCLFGIFHVS